jgi:predicted dehydrogenase
LVRAGGLGKILKVLAPCYPGVGPSPKDVGPAEPTPASLDWDIWLNQAAWRPFNHTWGGGGWDFCGGEMTNWGAHGLDQLQWGLGMDGTGPVEIWPSSPGQDGTVEMVYPNGVPVHFILGKGHAWGGCIFVGEKGKLEVNRNKFTSNPKEIAAELSKKIDMADEVTKWSDKTALWQARWHLQNWLDCIKTREKPAADVEIGHRSVTVCHLANLARHIGRRLKWDPAKEQFVGDDDANKLVDRPRRKGYELPSLT